MRNEKIKQLQNLYSWEDLYRKNNNSVALLKARKQIEELTIKL